MDFGERPKRGQVAVLSGASFNLWDPDFGQPYPWANRREVIAHLRNKLARQVRTSSSAFYGLDASLRDGLPMQRARIAFRDVARATDTRTCLVAPVPPNLTLTHKAPYLLRRNGDETDEAYLLGIMSSIPFDWYARRFVEISLTFELLTPMPVPRPARSDRRRKRVVTVAGGLAAVDDRFAAWAAEVGVPVASVKTAAEKQDLICELDALASHLYGLERSDVEHIFSSFHRGWDYKPRLDAVLAHYDAWADRS